MHAVIRTYSGKGAKDLFDLLEKHKADAETLIRSVKGFVSYSLVRTASGGLSISIFETKTGANASTRRARDWIKKNAPSASTKQPVIVEGSVINHFNK
jgi:hypothetical protein